MRQRRQTRFMARWQHTCRALAAPLVVLCALIPGVASPQQIATPVRTPTPDVSAQKVASDQVAQVNARKAADRADSTTPSSTELGQSPLDGHLTPGTRADWVRETRRRALEDTKFAAQIRSYFLDRDKFEESKSEAWALGGSVGFKTGYFRERLAVGSTGYVSQRLYGPEDKDGTLLLGPGQHGYGVLGELYGELLLNQDTRLTIGRRGFDTPYLNRDDSRMTPNTFEAIAVQGLYGGGEGEAEWRMGGGYFDQIKERNADEFISMAASAGAPDGVERGVYVGGANYKKAGFSLGAIDYYSDDIINIFYTESTYARLLGDALRLQFALQYSDQRGTGDKLLRGADFSAHQYGGKAELGVGGALFTLSHTSASGSTDIQTPWGSHPGYTSVQVEKFNRDGESAWMLRAAYNFSALEGLSVYALGIHGSDPEAPGQHARDEYDLNLQWTPGSGALKGLMMRLRYAHVSQHDPANSDLDDLRVMVYYDPLSLFTDASSR